jgi:membrane protein
LKDWRITRVLTTMADTFLTRRVTRSAAEIAYYMVMALFPVIICMYDLLALILRDPTAVLRIVETLVLPRETQALVSEFLNYVSGNTSQVMFIAALFVMITSASAAFRAMAAIVSEIHGDKRFGIVRNTVVSIIFSVTFLLVLYLCILLMLTGKHFLLWLDALMPRVSIVWSWTWLRFLVLFAILLMMILVLYRLTTPRRTSHRVLPGALFSAVGIVVMSILLSWLIGSSAKYSLVYGSLASVVILLFWFQVFGLLLILGVVLNHALEVTAPPKNKA